MSYLAIVHAAEQGNKQTLTRGSELRKVSRGNVHTGMVTGSAITAHNEDEDGDHSRERACLPGRDNARNRPGVLECRRRATIHDAQGVAELKGGIVNSQKVNGAIDTASSLPDRVSLDDAGREAIYRAAMKRSAELSTEDEAHKAAVIADMVEKGTATPEQSADLRQWLTVGKPLSADTERDENRTALCRLFGYPIGAGDRDLYGMAVQEITQLRDDVNDLAKALHDRGLPHDIP